MIGGPFWEPSPSSGSLVTPGPSFDCLTNRVMRLGMLESSSSGLALESEFGGYAQDSTTSQASELARFTSGAKLYWKYCNTDLVVLDR
jgi:hypothetical protein